MQSLSTYIQLESWFNMLLKSLAQRLFLLPNIFKVLMSEGISVLSPSQQGAGNQMVQVSVKKQKNIWNLFKLIGKRLTYKPLSMVCKFFNFFLSLSLPENLKNSIFEMTIILQIITITSSTTTRAKSINLNTFRERNEYTSSKSWPKALFTPPVFEVWVCEGRSVLSPGQLGAGIEMVKVSVKNFLKLFDFA